MSQFIVFIPQLTFLKGLRQRRKTKSDRITFNARWIFSLASKKQMDRKQIEKVITIYLRDLEKKIKIEKAILFGSAARGKIRKDSDIDLLVLSSSFANLPDDQRFDLLYTARNNEATQAVPMDIFGLTPQEYSQAGALSITAEIKETGKEVFSSHR